MTGHRNPAGMLLDRALTVELLELARQVARDEPDLRVSRRTLAIRLRDHVSDQEAEGKTKKCLTRAWLNPPPPAAAMIRWGRSVDVPDEALPVLHLGALLATFPIAAVVARVVSQQLGAGEDPEAAHIRSLVRRAMGDRPAVDVAARKTYTTFAHLGVVARVGRRLARTDQPAVPDVLGPWLAHAVLRSRDAEALPVTSVRHAPELLGLSMPTTFDPSYPLLDQDGAADRASLIERRLFTEDTPG